MNKTPKTRETKAKTDKRDLNKLKSYAQWKKLSSEWTGNLQNGRKFLQSIHLTESSYPDSRRNLNKFTKKQKQKQNPIKKWAKDMNRHFSKEDIYAAKKHEKILIITDY